VTDNSDQVHVGEGAGPAESVELGHLCWKALTFIDQGAGLASDHLVAPPATLLHLGGPSAGLKKYEPLGNK
jgi:hypothetical protein